MDKTLAASILRSALSVDAAFGEMDTLISSIADTELREKFTKALADLMGGVAADFIFPITDEFPDLANPSE